MVQKIRADITFKDGTAAEWQLKNLVLRPGEPGIATDTAKFEIGDDGQAMIQLQEHLNSLLLMVEV